MHTFTPFLASVALLARAPHALAREPQPGHDQIAGKAAIVVQDASRQLPHSFISAHLRHEHQPGRNIVWCLSFQLAWDQLAKAMSGPVQLVDPPPMAGELNATPAAPGLLDPASYVAMAGFGGDGILEKIRAELESKFKGAASPKLLPPSLPHEALLAYAYLFKNLQFEHELYDRKTGLAFGQSRVRSFGLWNEPDKKDDKRSKRMSQVVVRRYAGPDDFIVELRTRQTQDRLIISRRAPGKTLEETVRRVMSGLDGHQDPLRLSETLEVPRLDFDITRSFEELVGKSIANPEFTAYHIEFALQNIRLRLDEKGAVLKSEAAIGVTTAVVPRSERRFVCDGPFLVLMARNGAELPYFAAWIEHPELLVPLKDGQR
jgi:hypothetical protein